MSTNEKRTWIKKIHKLSRMHSKFFGWQVRPLCKVDNRGYQGGKKITDKWYAKIIFDNEGVETYETFHTKNEADAFVRGFWAAAEISSNGGDSTFDDYYGTAVDQIEPMDE